MSSIQISDNLWRQQDPAAVQPPRRVRRWPWLSAFAVLIVVAVVALPVAWHAGAFGPQIRGTDDGWNGMFVDATGANDPAVSGGAISSKVSGTITILNAGTSTVRILDMTVTGAGFRFDHANAGDSFNDHPTVSIGASPIRLAPRARADFTLYFDIMDCHAVSASPQFATIHVDSWRGVQTVLVALPTVRHLNGGWEIVNPADPHAISSVRYLADAVCGIGMDAG